jgi:hypothetical protein
MIMFLFGLLCAAILSGSRRAFAIGFVLWGVSYLALVGLVLQKENDGMGSLATTRLLKTVYGSIVREVRAPLPSATLSGIAPGTSYIPRHDLFMKSGQLMWSWVFGLVGGVAALWLHGTSISLAVADTQNN